MTVNNIKKRSKRLLRYDSLLLLLFIILSSSSLFSQVRVPFQPRSSRYMPWQQMYYLRGDYQLIGNTNLTLASYSTTTDNSNNNMVFVDIDTDPNTINSSSATLAFNSENSSNPNCSDVVYAGLYWTGRSDNANNGPPGWVSGGSSSNYTNGNTVECYNLTIATSGTGNSNVATYTFTPSGGGTAYVFRWSGGSTGGGGYQLTVQIGSGPITTLTNVVFPTNGSIGNTTNRTVTFNKPYALNTGSCTVYINSFQKRSNTPISTNFNANVTTSSVSYSTVYGYGETTTGGYNVVISGNGAKTSSNITTYTLTNSEESIVFTYSGASSSSSSSSLTVTRNGQTTNLSASYSVQNGGFLGLGGTYTATANLNPSYEILPGVKLQKLVKRVNDGDQNTFTTKNNFNLTFDYYAFPTMIAKNRVLFKHEDDEDYQEVFANSTNIWYPTTTDNYMYAAYTEVTDYVNEKGQGNYFVADMALNEGNGGSSGHYGGWGLVVVYQNSMMNWRNITLFDGYAFVDPSNTNMEINISGFQTIEQGNVNMKLGIMAGEGDRNIAGDFLQIKDQSNNWISLSHSGNSSDNFFNGSIVTGGNARNPNLVNNTGMDIAVFNVANPGNSIMTNNQTSTSFRLGSTQDAYCIFSLVMAVDAYTPMLDGLNTVAKINGISITDNDTLLKVIPGQEMEYRLEVRNFGNEPVKDALIHIPIPYTAEFVSAYTVYADNIDGDFYFDPSEDAYGAIIWTIDSVPTGTLADLYATLYYTFKITEDCKILGSSNCSLFNEVNGYIDGEGEITNVPFTNISFIYGYYDDGECAGTPIYENVLVEIDAENFVNQICPAELDSNTRIFSYCNISGDIPFTDVYSFFPSGSKFYSSYDPHLEDPIEGATEYTMQSGFPNIMGTYTYYALYPRAGCYAKFQIQVINFNAQPTVSVHPTYCKGDDAIPLAAIPSNANNELYYYTEHFGGAARTDLIPSTEVVGVRNYYVAEALSNGCISSQRAPITVTTNERIDISLYSDKLNNTICANQSIKLSIFSESPLTGKPYRFRWYQGDPASTLPLPNAYASDFTTSVSGDYWATVTDTLTSCQSVAGPIHVTVYIQPVFAVSELTLCGISEDTISLSVLGKREGAVVNIPAFPLAASASMVDDLVRIQTSDVATDQTKILTYTDGNGCTADMTLYVKSRPKVALPNNYTVCQFSGNQIISATTSNNSDDTETLYSWNGGTYSSNQSTYTLTTSLPGTETITVEVKNEDGCISSPASFTLTVREVPNITLTASDDAVVSNDTVHICAEDFVTFKVSPLGSSRTWRYAPNQNSNTDSLFIAGAAVSQTGWVKATVTQPGCIASDSMFLQVNPIIPAADIVMTIMNGSDTIRVLTTHSNPQIDTIQYTDSLWSTIYLPPTYYNCQYLVRIYAAGEEGWSQWDTISGDTTITRFPTDFLSGFNGIRIEYLFTCDTIQKIRCMESLHFEYLGLVQPDNNLIYTASPMDYTVCQQAEDVKLTFIYRKACNPYLATYEFRYQYMDGITSQIYYTSNWEVIADTVTDYILSLDTNMHVIYYIIPETPAVSIVETPDHTPVTPGDYVILSVRTIRNGTYYPPEGDPIHFDDTMSTESNIWKIATSLEFSTLIPNRTTCENDTVNMLSYHLSSFVNENEVDISNVIVFWGSSFNGPYTRLGLIDSTPYFDFEIDFHGYPYPHYIELNNFNTYDTLFFIVNISSQASTCPTLQDTFFIAVRDNPTIPSMTTTQNTCDSIYMIEIGEIPLGLEHYWSIDSLFTTEDDELQEVILARGTSISRFTRYVYTSAPYCLGDFVEIEVSRYGDITAGSIETGLDSICLGDTIGTVLNDLAAVPAYGNIQYRWLVNEQAIESGADGDSYALPDMYRLNPGYYHFVRQSQDECLRGWVSAAGEYELYVSSPTIIVPRNAEDQFLCFGRTMLPVTYFDTIAEFPIGLEQIKWFGTEDSTTPPAGISVNGLNSPNSPITISGTPTVSGVFTYVLYIPDAPACGIALTDTVTITIFPELLPGVIEPEIQYTSTNLTKLPLQNWITGSGGTGTNTYRWQYSGDGTNYTNIANTNNTIHQPNLPGNHDLYYRRAYENNCGTVYSNIAIIYFHPLIVSDTGLTRRGCMTCNDDFVTHQGARIVYPYLNQYGHLLKFLPRVLSNGVIDLTSTSATLNGSVLFNGHAPITEHGFEICTDTLFLSANVIQYQIPGDPPSTFPYLYPFSIQHLDAETTYYFRAYAINSEGKTYGQIMEFKTH